MLFQRLNKRGYVFPKVPYKSNQPSEILNFAGYNGVSGSIMRIFLYKC